MDPGHPHDDVSYDTALVSELLKAKRKSRGIKSCFPCRHRKVRCDGGIPCSNCVRRDHASLCRTAVSSPTPSASSTQSAPSTRPSAPSIGLLMNPITNDGCKLEPHLSRAEYYQGAGYAPQRNTETPTQEAALEPPPVHSREQELQTAFDPLPVGQGPHPDVQLTVKRLEEIEAQISSLKADLLGGRNGNLSGTNPSNPIPFYPPATASTAFVRRWGRRYIEGASGAAIFLGGRADPPVTLGCHDDPLRISEDGLSLENVMMPEQLAPRTYPFANLWTAEAGLRDVCRTLPHNSDIIRYWQAFETYVYPFYPALVALDEFRSSMFMFLGRRSTAAAPNHSSNPSPSYIETTDPGWLSLLFAVLACGAQFSDDAAKERDLRSKVFICSSFQCLRTANLFHKTDMNQIQAMALIGHSLRNNLETNSAWIFMATTLRLAQSIGLHEAASMPISYQLDTTDLSRRQAKHLWWILVWQDTLLSITYDRPTTSIFTTAAWTVPYTPCHPLPTHQQSPSKQGFSFAEAIFQVCQIMLDRSRQEHAAGAHPNTAKTADILHHSKKRLEHTVTEAAPYLRDESHCKTMQEHLERLALKIHVAYAACSIYRLYLDGNNQLSAHTPSSMAQNLSSSCRTLIGGYVIHASKAVQSFLDMYRLSPNVCRSWAFVHNAVSCAVTAKRFLPVAPAHSRFSGVNTSTGGNSSTTTTRSPGLSFGQPSTSGIPSLLNDTQSPPGTASFGYPAVPAVAKNFDNAMNIYREFEQLVGQLISVLEREEKQSEWRDADTNVRYFGPYSRALGALKETYHC